MTTKAEEVFLPWPDRFPVDEGVGVLRVADRVQLQHIARPEWFVLATVSKLTTPGRAVGVIPDEPITSPANWVIR